MKMKNIILTFLKGLGLLLLLPVIVLCAPFVAIYEMGKKDDVGMQ